jgi:hypothetical protein
LDKISISTFSGRVLISSDAIRDRVSVVVLWVGIVWLGTDGNLGDGLSIGHSRLCVVHWGSMGNWLGISYWGSMGNWLGISHRVCSVSVDLTVRVGVSCTVKGLDSSISYKGGSSGCESDNGQDCDELQHFVFVDEMRD